MTAIVQITGVRRILDGPVNRDMEKRARAVESAAKIRAPVDTGRMRASGYIRPAGDVVAAWDVLFPVNYAIYVDQGTRRMAARPFLSDSIQAAIR